jgi:hypothetical protein
MAIFKKCFNRLTIRCFGALVIGVGIMIFLVGGLALYSDEPESFSANPSLSATEEMLRDLPQQLADESKKLTLIAPASGDNR